MPHPLLPPCGIFVATMIVFPPLPWPTPGSSCWITLAEELDRCDRIYGAAARERLAIFQQILVEESQEAS